MYKNPKLLFGKNSLNVPNVKLLQKKMSLFLGFFDAFLISTFD
jgi:hypothetical protein